MPEASVAIGVAPEIDPTLPAEPERSPEVDAGPPEGAAMLEGVSL